MNKMFKLASIFPAILIGLNANAQNASRLMVSRPVLSTTTLSPLTGVSLQRKIAKPLVLRRITRRLPAVPENKFGPTTKFTLGLYDENGNINGSKEMTGKAFWDQLDSFTNGQKNLLLRSRRVLRTADLTELRKASVNTQLKISQVYDAQLRQNIEVVEIPQDIEVSRKFVAQGLRLRRMVVTPVVMRPIVLRPTTNHPAKPHTYSASYIKSWGSTSKFSAYVNASMKSYGSRTKRLTDGKFSAGGYVFKKQIKLVDFKSRLSRGSGTSHSSFAIAGKVKWESSNFNITKSLNYRREFSKRQRFWIGPLPVSVGGAIGGKIGSSLNLSSPSISRISGTLKPFIDSYGACDAAIDVWLARSGIEGSLRIIRDDLPSTLSLNYSATNKRLYNRLKVRNELKALDGKVKVYAKIRKFWGGWKKWSKTIFSWSGFQKNWNLIDNTTTVNI